MVRLADLRREAGHGRAALAELAGIPEATIAAIETGEASRLERDAIHAVARALEVQPSEIDEFRPALGIGALGQTGAGENAPSGARNR
jgi:DNA-binding Xre family transcriptional regulator